MAKLIDSGNRTEFSSGAEREINSGKGRCDLMPLDVVCDLIDDPDAQAIIIDIQQFMVTKDTNFLIKAIKDFGIYIDEYIFTLLLEVSKQFEDGAAKYSERNWEKGIPLHCYIDSGIRHLLKVFRGDTDEPHDRAFVWNMMCAIYTARHLDTDDINLLHKIDLSDVPRDEFRTWVDSSSKSTTAVDLYAHT